jgi:CheY-like chemotaxis protein
MKGYILVIDDDSAILEVLKIILEDNDYMVKTLSDGSKIQEALSERKPDMILLDIWLSGMDGQEIATKLKQEESTKKIPIVMISANNEGKKISKKAKIEGFIAKPFEIEDILDIVKKFINK